MTHPTTTLPADETSPTSPAPAPPLGTPVQPRPSVAGERRRWFRRNLTGIMAGTALVISIAGLGLPAAGTLAGPQGPPGIGVKGPAGPQGDPGIDGKDGKNGKDAVAAPAPEAPAPAEAAPAPEASGQSFSDGEYKVGTDIQPGEYAGKVEDQGEFSGGYWARLDSKREILDNSLVDKAGAPMHLTVRSSDAYVEISGATFHKVG
jgi:hypothetical protein